jgi:hypothetical protein
MDPGWGHDEVFLRACFRRSLQKHFSFCLKAVYDTR